MLLIREGLPLLLPAVLWTLENQSISEPGGLGQSLDLYTRTRESESLPSRLALSLLVVYRGLV